MAAASPAHLLDLPPDLLARIGAQLPFEERLHLSRVCRRWRDLAAGPSELWRCVDASIRHGGPGLLPIFFQPAIPLFVSWFAKRAAAVEELRLYIPQPVGTMLLLEPSFPIPAGLLHDGAGPTPPLPLRKIAISCPAAATLSFGVGDVSPAHWLPSLQKVALFDVLLRLPEFVPGPALKESPPLLTDLSLIGGAVVLGDEPGPIWLPCGLTALVLSDDRLHSMPFLLISPPKLRSLVVDHNSIDGSEESGLFFLPRLTRLEELNLSANPMGRPPPQIASLPNLRILYLHAIVRDGDEPPPPDAWEPLRACTALAFLAVSANGLTELPPAVAGMTHLRALHCEENNMAALLDCPCLSSLRELLLDWRTAMASPAALRCAAQLSRLILSRYQPAVPPADIQELLARRPDADALLDALAALPALRRLDDVYEEGNTHLVTAEQARVMWQLGRCCPRVQLAQPRSTNLGWTLSSLVAELPHNAGTAMLDSEPAA